jgi:hypothetical protein
MPQCSEIRFAVRAMSGHRAATWRAWLYEGDQPEFYVGCRELKGQFKASLHASGNWHVSFSEIFFEKAFPPASKPEKRFVRSWNRPNSLLGMTAAFRVIVPWFSATVLPEDASDSNSVLWFEPAPEDQSVVFHIVFTSPNSVVTGWPGKNGAGSRFVGSIRASTGETLWVVNTTESVALPPAYRGPAFKLRSLRNRGLTLGQQRAVVLARWDEDAFGMYDLPVILKPVP